MIESELVATGSIKGVMTGKHYNRSVRAHKSVYEALQRLRFESFLQTLGEDVIDEISQVGDCIISSLSNDVDCPDISTQVDEILSRYSNFVTTMSAENPTFRFWSTYIDMVQLMMLYIRATRTGDWNLHLSTVRLMIPWFFVTDRVNYSRYLPCYWIEMICLEHTNPCKFQLETHLSIFIYLTKLSLRMFACLFAPFLYWQRCPHCIKLALYSTF